MLGGAADKIHNFVNLIYLMMNKGVYMNWKKDQRVNNIFSREKRKTK